MKRLLWWFLVMAGLVSLLAVAGCDEDDNPVAGDPNDQELVMFSDQFDDMDDISDLMFDVSFEVIDIFLNPQAGKAAVEFAYLLEWHASSQYWVVTIEAVDTEGGTSFSAIDSIQFLYARGPVQEPVEDSVIEIINYLMMNASDTNATGSVYQHLDITKDDPAIDTAIVDGDGWIDLMGEWTEVGETDTTTCTVDFDYDITATDLKMATQSDSSDCPVSGMIQYLGAIAIECTGATTASLTGSWTVTQTFDYGSHTVVVTHGNNSWTVTEPCQ